MATATYYFNAYDAGVNEWANDPANMVDGSILTESWTNQADDLQLLTGNTCDGTNLGVITKVEIRAYGYIANVSRVGLTPVFSGTDDGDDHNAITGFSPAWSNYFDITSDTNAPATWTWNDVKDLDCKVLATFDSGNLHCYKVEIQVTYWFGALSTKLATNVSYYYY